MFDVACGGADVLRVIKFVWKLLDIVLFIVPMGLIVIITLDFFKSVIAGKEDEMKKNFNVAMKRILFCIVLFLVEPICTFAIGLVAGKDVDKANPGAFQCLEIAITEDDFSAYEINYDEVNNNNNGNSNGTTSSEDSENDTTETTDKNNSSIKPNKPSKEENK